MYDLLSYLWRPRPYDAGEQHDLRVVIQNAVNGEEVSQVQVLATDTVAQLCDAVFHATGKDPTVSYQFLHQLKVLEQHTPLISAGVRDGDVIYLAKTPLYCLTASHDGLACLWSLESDVSASSPLPTSKVLRCGDALGGVELSPCRTTLLTMSLREGGVGELWNATNFEPVCQLEGGAATAEFSPDGKCLAGVGVDGLGKVWSAETGKVLHTLTPSIPDSTFEKALEDVEIEMSFVFFSPCGECVVTGADDYVQVWSASTGKLLTTLQGHLDTVKAAAVSKCGKLVLTASADTTARLWCCETGKCLQVLRDHTKSLSSCAFAPNQHQALTAARDGTVKVWQLGDISDYLSDGCSLNPAETVQNLLKAPPETAECLFTLIADGGVVNDARFSLDGCQVLVADSDTVKLYSARHGDLQLTLQGVHEDWVRSGTFSPDGRCIATASYDGTACVWSTSTGKCLHTLKGNNKTVTFAGLVTL